MAEMYHINPASGRVNICRADPNNPNSTGCKFSKHQLPHFDFKHEAQAYKEEMLQNELGQFKKLTKVVEPVIQSDYAPVHIDENIVKDNITEIEELLKHQISQYKLGNKEMLKEYYSPEIVIEYGAKFDNLIKESLPWNPDDRELTKEDYELIQANTRSVFSQMVDNGDGLQNEVYGTLASTLQESVQILPNSMKTSLKDFDIMTKKLRSDNLAWDGLFQGQQWVDRPIPGEKEIADFDLEENSAAIPGDLILNKFEDIERMKDSYTGYRVAAKPEQGNKGAAYWIGDPPKGKRFKKVSETSEVWYKGEKHTVDRPLYEVQDTMSFKADIISSKYTAKDGENGKSVLLHEYTHMTQRLDDGKAEAKFYESLAGEKNSGNNGYDYFTGFPDNYMGYISQREVLTRSTEGIFYPTVNTWLWGKNRGNNADKVRQWVLGYWFMKDTQMKMK